MTALGILALLLAALPAVMVAVNMRVLQTPRKEDLAPATLVSILIPARNEAATIGPALEAALASEGVEVEVLVMNDGSTDGTAAIVSGYGVGDRRARVLECPPLPEGWTGKVHACQRLAEAARGTHFLFIDADVRLEPGAAAALASHSGRGAAALVSAVPRQVTLGFGELLTVPTINLLMLGYLPIRLMRSSRRPSLAAACGQLILAERSSYFAAGGHAAIRTSLHDGVELPRAFRRSGLKTDLVAGAELAHCRMYRSFGEAWAGFSKNAREGMATPEGLPIWTLLLFGGHVLPAILAFAGLMGLGSPVLALTALALSLGARSAVTLFSRENLLTIPLHPATVVVALAIQWGALLAIGSRPGWKGRVYPASRVREDSRVRSELSG